MTTPDKESAESRYLAIKRLVFRIASFMVGVGILYHEVWVTKDSEPLLDFIALWLMGLPIADLAAHISANLLGQAKINGSDSPSPKKDDGQGS